VATFVAASGGSSTATSGSVTMTLPTGWAAGDLIVGVFDTIVTGTSKVPAGWSMLRDSDSSAIAYRTSIFYRVMQSGDTAPVITVTGKSSWNMIAFRPGAGNTLAWDTSNAATDTASGTTIAGPALAAATGTVSGISVIVTNGRAVGTGVTAITTTAASTWTEPTNGDQSTAAGTTTALRQIFSEVAYKLAVSGTVTPGNATLSASSAASSTHILLKELAPSDLTSGTLTLCLSDMPGVFGSTATTAVVSATSGTITAPAKSLIVIAASVDAATAGATAGSAASITDSLGTHLTWTRNVLVNSSDSPAAGGGCVIWSAPCNTAQSFTVTVTNSSGGVTSGSDFEAYPFVFTDSSGNTPEIGATAKSAFTSGTTCTTSYTATSTDSWGIGVVNDWSATGTPTASTSCTSQGGGTSPGLISYGFTRRTAADGASGSSTTVGMILAGASTASHVAAVEVKAPAGGGVTPYSGWGFGVNQ
jgi:hypothetical protein